ncbi:hypothetical protein [Pseudoalteromonas xiamenensis]
MWKSGFRGWLVLVMLIVSPAIASDVVRYNRSQTVIDPKQNYYIALLTLALQKSKDTFGDFQLQEVFIEEANQARTLEFLEAGQFIDVHWTMTSIERERKLGTVYIPLLKGMMGARLFIVHKDSLPRLSQLTNPLKLKELSVGSGFAWPDTRILKDNGFEVTVGSSENLINMLEKKRFALFPRAIHEPWSEVNGRTELVVEENLGLCYPVAMYFFTNQHNSRLRERLQYGLEKAIEDGSFDTLFATHPITADVLSLAHFEQRKVLPLQNEGITARTRQVFSTPSLVWQPVFDCVKRFNPQL